MRKRVVVFLRGKVIRSSFSHVLNKSRYTAIRLIFERKIDIYITEQIFVQEGERHGRQQKPSCGKSRTKR